MPNLPVLKPHAATLLIRTLRQEVGLPIHLHTHDSAGGQLALPNINFHQAGSLAAE